MEQQIDKKMRKTILTLAIAAACTGLSAQDHLSLTLEQAQQYAVENNKSLQNASLEVRQAHAQRWQTIAAMLPQADLSLGLNHATGYLKFMETKHDQNYTSGSLSANASVAINGQMIVGALLNNIAIEMQNISLAQSEKNLRANVTTTYMTVLVMEDIVSLLDSSLTNIEQLAEMTQRSVEVGVAEQTSADQIMVKVNALKNSINSNKRNVELARNSLKVLLGLNAETELTLSQTLDELLSAESALALLNEGFDINNNHDYQLLQKNVELAKKNVTMAGLAYAPTLSAFYQYTAPNKYFSGETTMEQQMGVVGLSLSVPVWSSGKRAAAVTEKKLAYQAAVNTFEETSDNLGIQDQQLRFNLSNAYETYMNERDNIEVTKRVFNSTANKFEHGVASSLDLTNASNDLISAQSTYVQAILTLVNAQVELTKFLNK